MVAYLDSSVLLRYLLLGETTLRHVQAFPRLVSSELLEIECRRVLLRCRLKAQLDDEALMEATKRLDDVLESIDLLELGTAVKKRAMEAFPTYVNTLDALHLASALQLLAEEPAEGINVFSHDRSFNLCARTLGFRAALL
ncbi:MAG: hypothetical protein CVV51_08375 [Spirochaetae bacterium HGW-Spirochaetae-7]|jgi:predicted nucleic acid-binding protein|nr:MAG: hypothetical protein CVV51_08375 [Spirochaetae bacterium HGW-Spirochaetae-7]